MTANFRVLDHVKTRGAPVSTKDSFEIRDGVPGLQARDRGIHVTRLRDF